MKHNHNLPFVTFQYLTVFLQQVHHCYPLNFVGQSRAHQELAKVVVDLFLVQGRKVPLHLPHVHVRQILLYEFADVLSFGADTIDAQIRAEMEKLQHFGLIFSVGEFIPNVLPEPLDVFFVVFLGVLAEDGGEALCGFLFFGALDFEGDVVSGDDGLLFGFFVGGEVFEDGFVVLFGFGLFHSQNREKEGKYYKRKSWFSKYLIINMKENQKTITEMLEEEGCEANSSAKQAITDFSILYAKKLLKKCLFPNKDSINPDDLRIAYETMNKMHSAEYEEELEKKKMKMISYVTALTKEKYDKTPAQANTVSLYFKSEMAHMRTNWEYQLAFDSNGG